MNAPPESIDNTPVRGAAELIVYGRRSVLEALATGTVEVVRVCAGPQLSGAPRRAMQARCRERGVRLEPQSRGALSQLSRDPRNDQGVVAVVRLLRLQEVDGFCAQCTGQAARLPTRLLAFDGITNSQNVGMMVRSAVAAGMTGVLWPTHGTPWVNGLVVKASAGAVFRCPIVRCESLELGLAELCGAGFTIVGLQPGRGTPLHEYDPPHRAVFVVGGETHGLSASSIALLDQSVHIPIHPEVESLNAAVAGSLLCFHVGGISTP